MVELVSVRLSTDVATRGCEVEPSVFVKSDDAFNGISELEPDLLPLVSFTWYRSKHPVPQDRSTSFKCTYHPSELATLLNISSKTYHCTKECFIESWKRFRQLLRQPSGKSDWSLGDGDDLGGWIEVGCGRVYTPTEEDVGHGDTLLPFLFQLSFPELSFHL